MRTPPRLSFCMIARDEAANIVRCLTSVRPIVDEMIVVDTGSTDDTAALAESCGATVHHVPWADDFAAAYNAALDRVTGDWIFGLDADEWLLPESQSLVRDLIRNPRALAYFVQRQEVKREGQTEGFVEMRHLRLGRNIPDVRLVGRDHPSFRGRMEQYAREHGLEILDSPVRIRHTGYLPEKMPAKLARAARLLPLELSERPGQLYHEIELAFTWDQLKDPRGARLLEDVLARVLAHADASYPPTVLAARVLEWCLKRHEPRSPQVSRALDLAMRWFPASPPLLDACARVHYVRAEYAKAAPLLERLTFSAENGQYDRAIAFNGELFGDKPYLNLAACYHRLGRLDAAETCYRRLLARHPDHPEALRRLQGFRRYTVQQPAAA